MVEKVVDSSYKVLKNFKKLLRKSCESFVKVYSGCFFPNIKGVFNYTFNILVIIKLGKTIAQLSRTNRVCITGPA